ncbi:hypothetical protein TNIN_308171 [Trichonephila inaurata madagascariensis]|uniref:Uncharacterized protein n=1 Tax=Trichonephila inaurata madagascariensis TaxID=2747483 RepID=A0A8X7CLS5_9ARAC|nr:hypothetical protein TNIN_308171 [Trichonephila inaurata madagascariensis]
MRFILGLVLVSLLATGLSTFRLPQNKVALETFQKSNILKTEHQQALLIDAFESQCHHINTHTTEFHLRPALGKISTKFPTSQPLVQAVRLFRSILPLCYYFVLFSSLLSICSHHINEKITLELFVWGRDVIFLIGSRHVGEIRTTKPCDEFFYRTRFGFLGLLKEFLRSEDCSIPNVPDYFREN